MWKGGGGNLLQCADELELFRAAVPGRLEQRMALESIKQAWRDSQWGGLYLFTAFDDPWKVAEPGTFYAEQFWGME